MTALSQAPTKIVETTLGLYLGTGTDIYKWEVFSQDWVKVYDGSAVPFTILDIVEMDGILYAARDGASYLISDSGSAWEIFTDLVK